MNVEEPVSEHGHLVDVGAHWPQFRMVECPIGDCGARHGEDYQRFAYHVLTDHGPEDVGLEPIVGTGGGAE